MDRTAPAVRADPRGAIASQQQAPILDCVGIQTCPWPRILADVGKRIKLGAANRSFPNSHAESLGSHWLAGLASAKSMHA